MPPASYQDEAGIRGWADSGGAYGDIPMDFLFRKNEVTPMIEDEYAVENYMRQNLVDFRPDKPFLASDQIRRGDDPNGGFGSRGRLKLQYEGSRSGLEPRMPEGVFLDHDFSHRDPRGTATAPDMRRYRDEGVARLPFIKMSPDADYTIPEQLRNPEQLIRDKSSMFYPVKNRMLIFDTARGNFHTGGTGVNSDRSWRGGVAGNGIDAGLRLDLADVAQGNRVDATTIIGQDDLFAQQWSIPDNRFKVAKYGHVRGVNPMEGYDQQMIRIRQQATQDMVESHGMLMGRKLGMLIADAEGVRSTKQLVTQGIAYGDSSVTRQRRGRVAPADVLKLLHIISPTQDHLVHDALTSQHMARKIRHSDGKRRPVLTTFNREIAESMEQSVSRGRDRSGDDLRGLRDRIEQTAVDGGVYAKTSTKAALGINNMDLTARNGVDNRHIVGELTTRNYGAAVPMVGAESPYLPDRVEYDHTVEQRAANDQRQADRGAAAGGAHEEDVEFNHVMREFGLFTRADRADRGEHVGRNIQGEILRDALPHHETLQAQRVDGRAILGKMKRANYGRRRQKRS